MPAMNRVFCYLWVAPTSALGALFLVPALLSGGGAQIVSGVLEIHGGFARWFLWRVCGLWLRGGASAMTLGHVVLGLDPATLRETRAHERIHVRQCEIWGPLFIPAYLGASAWAWARGKRAYFDNPFEREAYGKN